MVGAHVEHGLVIRLAVLVIAPTRSCNDICWDDSDSQHREWLFCRNQAGVLTHVSGWLSWNALCTGPSEFDVYCNTAADCTTTLYAS